MAMSNRATFSALLFFGLLVTGCTSTTQGSLGPASTTSPNGSAANSNSPASRPEALTTPQPGATPPQQPLARSSLNPNRCPGIVANPIGCPASVPPPPIAPQTGNARILLCAQPFVAGVPPGLRGAVVCGAGFHPEELVTISVRGRLGSTSWQVGARPDGTFRSVLPPAACRLMPAYATARGNRGSVSNPLPLTITACFPIP